MIEIILLKERHATEEEAKKLRPYIEWCDIYGKENAACSTEDAEAIEEDWNNSLHNLSRTAFRKWREKCHSSVYSHKEIGVFMLKTDDYLFRAKKPIWFVERFEKKDSEKIRGELAKLKHVEAEALNLFLARRFDDFSLRYRGFLKFIDEMMQSRDMNIAYNLENAEDNIRRRYPALRDKNPLKFAVGLGGSHFPEEYCKKDMQVIQLYQAVPLYETVGHDFFKKSRSGVQIDEREVTLVALARLMAMSHHLDNKFKPEEIRTLSLEEIQRRI